MADLVVDASVASAWCFPDERSDYTNGVLQAVSSAGETAAPSLWAYEVRNCVLIGLRRGRIGKDDAQGFLASLSDLAVRLIDPASYDDVFHLAERHGLTVYDAAYLDLAIREHAKLASLDDALRRAATKVGVTLFDAQGAHLNE